MDFCEELRHPPETCSHITTHGIRRGLKVNHSFPLPICLHYCCGMLQLVILILSRERWQITHPKQTLQLESLHPAKEKPSLETSEIPYQALCTCQCHSFIRQRSQKSSGTRSLLFQSPQGASSVSTTHSRARDSPRQLFWKLPCSRS